MRVLSKLTSNRRAVWITIIVWVLIAAGLSFAPSAGDYTINNGDDDLPENAPSVIADETVESYFPDDDGQLGLLVFELQEEGPESIDLEELAEVTEWLDEEAEFDTIDSVVPFHHFSDEIRTSFTSDDGEAAVLTVTFQSGLETEDIQDTVAMINEYSDRKLQSSDLFITGPAGIAADTTAIFSEANLTLMFSTIGLVLVLLIAIYRSPLLATIPLIGALFVYQVTDRLLGLFAANGVFTIEAQSLSIVMILLFGATTDYSLFVFSRFKEELRQTNDKYAAMNAAQRGVSKPIFFSGATVAAAMLVLLLAQYGPYNNFAWTFAITISIVLLAGLTLIPALFTAAGRKAFWPAVPKAGEETLKKNRFWGGVGTLVTKKPVVSGGIVLLFLIINALNVPSIQTSYNLIDSFPEDLDSRVGFDILEEKFPSGELAPVSVLLEKDDELTLDEEQWQDIEQLQERLIALEGVYDANFPDLEDAREGTDVSEDGKALRAELILEKNPYDLASLDAVDLLNEDKDDLLVASGLNEAGANLYFSGESATQADIQAYNSQDTLVVASVVTIVITLMLVWHTRSLIAPLYMMSTILLSYLSALGLSWFIFDQFTNVDAFSYRIPLYAFVFLVALGVDYNIMLVSRIMEENKQHQMRYAVQRAVAQTGGVISSAGVILAATFGVLMTQPLKELYLFGFIVGLGILLDTFLVRGILVPAIVTLLGKWNWRPFNKMNS
ncbi:MMPL family transporter [Salisediminibacterium halotolerans]|uniref:Drug exporter of the RND superfamily n=1 Tax=Salisediminibacterium halotolerans TaxID=517425 RepID=A0A1H9SZN7_9BACI|nr:MMPL family transporter [Salisediminibacterium haloalkalitolerans]SER89833.1 putative drug exporter of the RND superfamily [Salisediminibacterium haloalkalitolerans]